MNSSDYNIPRAPWNRSFGFLPNGTASWPRPGDNRPQEDEEVQRIVIISYFLLLTAVSLFGNTSILAIFIKNKEMRITSNYFIINMAISDLLYVLFVIPPHLEQMVSRSSEWKLGLVACKLTYFIRDVSFTVSILSMLAIALERFYAVVYPMHCKPKYVQPCFAVPVVWLLSTSTFAIYLYSFQLVFVHPIAKTFCIPIWAPAFDNIETPRRLYVFSVLAFFVVPLVFITVFYGIIIHRLKAQDIPGVRTSETEKLRRKRNRSITKVGVLVVLCFFFSWAPYHCLLLLITFLWKQAPLSVNGKTIQWLLLIFSKLSVASVASNSLVCYACSSRFRSCLKKMLSDCCCPFRKQRQRVQAFAFNSRCTEEVTSTQLSRFQDDDKTKGITNKGILTGETVELESGWVTKL